MAKGETLITQEEQAKPVEEAEAVEQTDEKRNQIEVSHLAVGYDEKQIIADASLRIAPAKITTIIGPNGCGKSTLLKAITRIIPHAKGSVCLDGKSIARMNTKDLAKRMAILPQITDSPNGITVGELVSYGRYPYQTGFGKLKAEDYEIIDWALDLTHTQEFKLRDVNALSGGQRQRVWIAMALAQKTDIIFLDEPTTYLDLVHQLEVLTLLQKLNRENHYTIVMVLHDLNQAARFSDEIIAMRAGEIIRAGEVAEVINPDILRRVFGIEAEIVQDPKTGRPICLSYDFAKKDVDSTYAPDT